VNLQIDLISSSNSTQNTEFMRHLLKASALNRWNLQATIFSFCWNPSQYSQYIPLEP